MKILKSLGILALAASLLVPTGCNFTNTGKGAAIGGGAGAALGAALGAAFNGGKGAAIGAAIGAVAGAGAGTLIGNKMDKQKKELAAIEGAQVESVTDDNGLPGVKVTFAEGILFKTGKADLSASSQKALSEFATSLQNTPDTNVQIYGYTDNTGSYAANERVANNRSNNVKSFLLNKGVAASRLAAVGVPMDGYLNDNATAADRAKNRRVEIYITANEEMVKQANEGTLK